MEDENRLLETRHVLKVVILGQQQQQIATHIERIRQRTRFDSSRNPLHRFVLINGEIHSILAILTIIPRLRCAVFFRVVDLMHGQRSLIVFR